MESDSDRLGTAMTCTAPFRVMAGLLLSMVAYAQGGGFAKLDFGGNISIEVPRNWSFLDSNLRRHLDTRGEAIARLAGITPNPGENVILVAGNAFTSFHTPSATLRLSVRQGSGPSQADMREIARLPAAEVLNLLKPVADETRRAMIGVEGVKNARSLDARVVTNKSLICMMFEFETDTTDGLKVSQTYICPIAAKSVKLSTSYRKSEASMFRPITEYVWESLSAR